MAISRFDQGQLADSLVLYYNPNEPGTIDVSGINVTTLRPGYAGKGPDLTQIDGVELVTYDPGNTMVANMNAISTIGLPAAGLIGAGSDIDFSLGMTIVSTSGGSAQDGWLYHLIDVPTDHQISTRRYWTSAAGGHHGMVVNRVSHTFDAAIPYSRDNPAVTVSVLRPVLGEPEAPMILEMYLSDSVAGDFNAVGSASNWTNVTSTVRLSNHAQYGSYRGNQGLFAVYNSALSPAQITDVIDLSNSWMTDGSAPVPEYDTTTSFGPAIPNDPSATLHWEVQMDSDLSDSWVSPDAAGLDVSYSSSNASYPNDTMIIKSAVLGQDCDIRCRATTGYSPEGIITPVLGNCRLEVVGGS